MFSNLVDIYEHLKKEKDSKSEAVWLLYGSKPSTKNYGADSNLTYAHNSQFSPLMADKHSALQNLLGEGILFIFE